MNEHSQTLWQFMLQQSDKLLEQTLAHIGLTFISLFISVLIGIPLGIFISKYQKFSGAVLGIAGVLQTIPSIALLGFMIPLLGIGATPAIVALLLYALLPIIRNTYTGITQVNASVVDAAKGMGMSSSQVLFKVELPLAMPVLLAGIRTATVINVGVATLAAYIAAGGLGEFIFGGIALNNTNMILAGAIPAALLAIVFDFGLARLQKMKIGSSKKIVWVAPIIMVLFSGFYLLPSALGSNMLAGFTPEFMGRTDGYLGLKKDYNLNIRTVVISDAVMYKAIYQKKIDVISGYSTDGRLKAFDLTVLQDDKTIFPPYYACPIIRTKFLEKHPNVEAVCNMLAGRINDSIMTDLNYRVDYLKQLPEKVATDFLQRNGLYKASTLNKTEGVIKIGSKIFGEQYILAAMYAQLIEGYTHLKVETKSGLGGTKICFDALINDEIDMYPEYTGTGLLVLLQPSADLLKRIMGDREQVYDYVKTSFINQYKIKWLTPIGFNNAYALMMRKNQAQSLGIKTISDLSLYIDKQ